MPRYAKSLDGSVTPLWNFLPRGVGDGGLAGRRAGGTDEEVRHMTFDQWLELVRTHWKREEGQTMAEYGVVLAVITIGAVAVFTALSGGISGALNRVVGLLPS
jgi:Flp pilus assembly pilin Flp